MRFVPIVQKRSGRLSRRAVANPGEDMEEESARSGSLPVRWQGEPWLGMIGLGPKVSVKQLVS
jgi:hypothetical protein